MPRNDQLARQWQALQLLTCSAKGQPAAAMALSLGCTVRTLYRDLEALQHAGFPVYNYRDGSQSLWTILNPDRQRVPVPFRFTEILSLYFCRDMILFLKGTMFYDSLAALLDKITACLPEDVQKFLHEAQKTVRVSPGPCKDYTHRSAIIGRLSEAATKRTTVSMSYYAMHSRRETSRLVDPYTIWFFNGTFYLIAYCHLRKQVRVFTLERIRSLRVTDRHYSIPEDFCLEKLMNGAFGAFRGTPEHVRVQFGPGVSGYIQETLWHESQRILPREDGSVIFEAQVAITDDFISWILSWGAGATVLEPGSLRETVIRELQDTAANYNHSGQ